jgi:hypothetical protein
MASYTQFTTDTSTVNVYLDVPFKGNIRDLVTADKCTMLASKRRVKTKNNTTMLRSTSITVGTKPVSVRERVEIFNAKSGKLRSNFKNSLTFSFQWDGRDRNIKYFNNGSMTLNGCKSETEINDVAAAFVAGVATSLGEQAPKIERVVYRMINASFWVRGLVGRLDLSHMNTWCAANGHNSFYDCDRSAPLKLNMNIAKVTLYATGNVQIKAMKTFGDTPTVHEQMVALIGGYLQTI